MKRARAPGDDSYWQFHRDRFLEPSPPPVGRTLDVGCGEGRLARDLASRGYRVVGCDASETLIRFAREADPAGDYRVTNAAALPFDDRSIDLVTAFMSLHDMDDMEGAVRGGRSCARSRRAFVCRDRPPDQFRREVRVAIKGFALRDLGLVLRRAALQRHG